MISTAIVSNQEHSTNVYLEEEQQVNEEEEQQVNEEEEEELELKEPIPIPDKFENAEQYIKIMKALIREDRKCEIEAKEKLTVHNVELEFRYSNPIKKKGGGFERIWITKIPIDIKNTELNSSSIDKNDGMGSRNGIVRFSDDVIIKWGTNLENCFRGRIELIHDKELTVSIRLKEGCHPPDCLDPREGRPSSEISDKVKYTVSFEPSSAVLEIRIRAIESIKSFDSDIREVILGHSQLYEFDNDLRYSKYKLPGFELTATQKKIVAHVMNNVVTFVQGSPGTGKTHTISAITYNMVPKGYKIFITGPSNASVENLVKVVSQNKDLKIAWITTESRDFKDIYSISDAEKHTAFYKMLNMESDLGKKFKKLTISKQNNKLSADEINELKEIRYELERQIVDSVDVVFATHESASRSCFRETNFNLVITDEATQAYEPSTIVPLTHNAEKWVVFGDQKQLGPVVNESDKVLKRCKYDQSLFERLINGVGVSYMFLDVQFRMNPQISCFINETFYNGNISDYHDLAEKTKLTTRAIPNNVVFVNTNGEEVNTHPSFKNEREAKVVTTIINNMIKDGVNPNEIGVITPYASQVAEIVFYLQNKSIKVSTVDSFQGSEKKYIIVSTVRTNTSSIGFVANPRRINVTLTRAQIGLVVVGNAPALYKDPIWGSFIIYIKNTVKSFITDDDILPSQLTISSPRKKNKRIVVTDIRQLENSLRTPVKVFDPVIERPSTNRIDIIKRTIPSAEDNDSVDGNELIVDEKRISLIRPDDSNSMETFKRCVSEKVQRALSGKNVTVSIHSTPVTIQLSEVFSSDFIINGDVTDAPHFTQRDSFIIYKYDNKGVLCIKETSMIIRQLMETSEKITILTYGAIKFIHEIYGSRFTACKSSIIDTQLFNIEEDDLENSKDLIFQNCDVNLQKAASFMTNNDPSTVNLRKSLIIGSHDIRMKASLFVIRDNNLPITSMCTKDFLIQAAKDVIFIGLLIVDIIQKQNIGAVIAGSSAKIKEFIEMQNKGSDVLEIIEYESIRLNIPGLKQGIISETTSLDVLIRKCHEFEICNNLFRNNHYDDSLISNYNSTVSILRRRMEDVKKLAYIKKNAKIIKRIDVQREEDFM